MWKRLFEKVNKQRGSATIEAVVAFTGFILVIFTILSLVNLCRAQMLISAAMDNAAKELSQYAYFYKMSGLQNFSNELGEIAKVGREDINKVIGSVDGFYGTMVDALDSTTEGYTNIANATMEGTLQWSDIESAYNGVTANKDNINSSINNMMTQFEAIGDNPMAYMKSLVAIAGSEGLDLAKSHLIAAPLAKMFVRQQFGGREKADETLEKLGVKNGLDGMNFKMSSIFTREYPDDICLVVYYELELLQLFDRNVLTMKMCKQSRTGAWLAGDNVQAIVHATEPPAVPSGSGTTGSTTNPGDTTDPTVDTTDPVETTETTEPTTEKVDTTGSYWHLDNTGKYMAIVNGQYGSSIGCDFLHHLAPVNGVPIQPTQSTPQNLKSDNPKQLFRAYTITETNDGTDDSIYLGVIDSLKSIELYLESNDTETVERTLYYEVYVPENISDEEYEKLEKAIEEAEEKIDNHIDVANMEGNETVDPAIRVTTAKNADYEIRIVKSGGNYDYSGGGN